MSANTVGACHALITSNLPETFPRALRFHRSLGAVDSLGLQRHQAARQRAQVTRQLFRQLPSLGFVLQQHRRHRIYLAVFHREYPDGRHRLRPSRHVRRDRCAPDVGKKGQGAARACAENFCPTIQRGFTGLIIP